MEQCKFLKALNFTSWNFLDSISEYSPGICTILKTQSRKYVSRVEKKLSNSKILTSLTLAIHELNMPPV